MILAVTTGVAFSEPVAAASYDVNSSMSNAQIQNIIDNAGLGDTINFLSGIYSNISLTITYAVNLISQGATLMGTGSSPVISITGNNAAGTNVTNFTISNTNSTGGKGNGISASNTNNVNVVNDTIQNTNNAVTFSNVNGSSVRNSKISNASNYGVDVNCGMNYTNYVNKNNVVIDNNIILNTLGVRIGSTSGVSVTNNIIGNNSNGYGISGMSVFSSLMENNTIFNVKDGVNIAQWTKNNTINNNNISANRDGISVVNHATDVAGRETDTSSSITNNYVSGPNQYALFIGGNFQGNISGNTLQNSSINGVQITGKQAATNGLLNATFTNNIIGSSAIGISMENPNVQYLNFSGNNIQSNGYSIQYTQNYMNNGVVIMENNVLNNPQNFIVNSSMTNGYIQSIIDGANLGDTITFLSGTYNNIALTITQTVNLISQGATLMGTGSSPVISITGDNAAGTNVTNFTISNTNSTGGKGNGISASNTNNVNVVNDTIQNTNNAVLFTNVNNSSVRNSKISNASNYGVDVNCGMNYTNYVNKNNVVIDNNIILNTTGVRIGSTSGVSVTNNIIGNNSNGYGINGMSVFSSLIENNTIFNVKDGVNIAQWTKNNTINNNNITNANRDGISVVNHATDAAGRETDTSSSITNNHVSGSNQYALFIGGNFQGNISGNTLQNSSINGVQITGKPSATNGLLNATFTNNIIGSSAIGISMENPNVQYLNFSGNNIQSNGYSIQYTQNFRNNGVIIEENNILSNPQNFIVNSSMTNGYIQSIIDSANLGDTITFLSGTYNNIALTITKAVNMVGNGAILNGAGNDSVLTVLGDSASGTSITGFTIANGTGHYGVCLNSANNVTVANNTITGNMVGVDLFNSANNTITNNKVTGNSWSGICLDTSNGNVLVNNNVSSNQEGVFMANSAQNTISSNVVSGNAYSGISDISGTHNTIQGNTLQSNVWNGMLIQRSTDDVVSGNTLQNNTWSSITIDGSTASDITGNSVSGSQEGIFVANGATGNLIGQNTINNIAYTGISVLSGSNNNTISANQENNSGSNGIFIQNSNQNTVKGNTVQNNGWSGVCLDQASNTSVTMNNIENNPEQGIAVGGSNNTFNSNYWSDWNTTYPRPIDGNNNIYDNNPQLTPY
ncbi:right-handed parallel beta-helix repeat-containing protein [uncultured Methanobacterium sp.]|uniref:right-handed parallel beta-helix repeat-containing protein n=1 Tax=uncultured Methanobacterium sp. TaxID=176306 RepID=UPI002AA855A8|nr:right-handed parallel beta-helix repeat-containing protein [uncultured Methanobacterium sp.]